MKEFEQLNQSLQRLQRYFIEQLHLLKTLVGSNLTGRAYETRIVIASACSTGSAIHELGKNPQYFYAEMMMLARSFIEKLTNFCYVQICTEDEYRRFRLHPFYRMYHNCDRSKYTAKHKVGLLYSGKEELKQIPEVREALSMFSETNPRKSWSEVSIDQKVAFLAEKAHVRTEFFLLNTISIYSNASEALHGSLYGCALVTERFTLGVNHDDPGAVQRNLIQNTALLYVQLGSIVHELIQMLTPQAEIKEVFEASNKNQQIAVNEMKNIFNKDNGKAQ